VGPHRVLYDAVLAVRMTRPQISCHLCRRTLRRHAITRCRAKFAQEAFKVAGDPRSFPSSQEWLQPWQPLAVYSRAPFARIQNGQMFDYHRQVGPARFHNYLPAVD